MTGLDCCTRHDFLKCTVPDVHQQTFTLSNLKQVWSMLRHGPAKATRDSSVALTRAAVGGGVRAPVIEMTEPDERILRGEYIVQALASSDKGPAGRTKWSAQTTDNYLAADGRL
ncbi:hypothetical protein J6590_009534 [Homalodisca vitripennis]|nr:hypothetical protein J6590_009534 [Homalodisca vitripennis]